MNAILTIITKNLKEQFKSPVFWGILVLFPIAELFMFKSMFTNSPTQLTATIKVTILNVTDGNIEFSKLAIIVLAQFFLISSVVASGSLIQEKVNNTLMRIISYPISKAQILIAHFICLVIEHTVVITIIMVLISIIFKVVWSTNYLVLSLTVMLCIILSSGFGLFLSLLFKNSNIASGIMSGVVILMSFLNGDMTAGKLPFNHSDLLTLNKWISSAFNKLHLTNNFTEIRQEFFIILLLGITFTALSVFLFSKENSYE